MDIDSNDRFRGMTAPQQAVFDTASRVLEQWVRSIMSEALGIEVEQRPEVAAHEQAFWIVYFALVEQAAKLAALAEPVRDSSEAVRKLTIDYRRALERRFGVSGVSLSSGPVTCDVPPTPRNAGDTPRTSSPEDVVVQLRMRRANLVAMETGILLGEAGGAPISVRLVPQENGEHALEVTGPLGASEGTPDPVDLERLAEGEVAKVVCSVCGELKPIDETVTRKFAVAEGRWTGQSTRIVCLSCVDALRHMERDNASRATVPDAETPMPRSHTRCPGCGGLALEGRITCGDVRCEQAGRR